MATLQDVLALARRGVPVFPLRPGTKDGYLNDASDHGATTDPITVFETFRNSNLNFGCWGGGRYLYIDVDAKNGGREAWDKLVAEIGGLPRTFTVASPRGGLHFYFENGGEVFSQAPLIKGAVDVRSAGGYVVGPGSEFTDPKTGVTGKYTIVDASPIAPLPDNLRQRLRLRAAPSADAGQIVSDLDTPEAIAKARGRLDWALPAKTGFSGDDTTFKLACALLDFGLSDDKTHELMLHSPWNAKSLPPWMPDELRVKVDNAWAYKQAGIGRDSPSAGFYPMPAHLLRALNTVVDASTDASVASLPFDWVDDLPLDARVSWLVDEAIPEASAGFLAADSSAGKTFQAVHLAQCLAYGVPYGGRAIAARGGTVFVAAEGAFSIPARIQASTDYCFRKMELPPGVDVDRRPIIREKECADLLSPQGCARFIERLKTIDGLMRERYGVPLRLLIIDTFAAAFALTDENNASEITRATNAMRRIASTLNIVVLATHHYGKDKKRGMRGNSALRANADFVLAIPSPGELRLEKCRDAAEGLLGSFTLPIVTLGTRDNGKPVTSRYVEWLKMPVSPNASAGFTSVNTRPNGRSPKRSKDAITLSAAFDAIAGSAAEAPRETVRTEFCRLRQGNAEAKRQAFGRALAAARQLGQFQAVDRDGQDFLVRSLGI